MSIEVSEKLLLLPGFSGSLEFVWPFANALTGGPLALGKDIDIILCGDAMDDPELVKKAAYNKTIVTHSAGALAAMIAGVEPVSLIAYNAPEPSRLFRDTARGAVRIAFDKDPRPEPGIELLGLTDPIKEFLRHPVENTKIPLNIRKFSATEALVKAAMTGQITDIAMFPTDDDWFGFTRPEAITNAKVAGIHTEILQGKHNAVMFQPSSMLSQTRRSLGIDL